MKGVVIQMFNNENGIIKGDDNLLYHFSKINYLRVFELHTEDKVVFKPIHFHSIHKALMIIKK
jgi:hypothetical protein